LVRSFAVAVAFLFIAASLRRSVEVCDNIADNLRKAVEVGAVSQRLIITGEQSGLQTLIATTESVSLCMPMEKLVLFWNWNLYLLFPAAHSLGLRTVFISAIT